MVPFEDILKTPGVTLTNNLLEQSEGTLRKALASERSSEVIKNQPSASLETAFLEARARARGGQPRYSLIMVMLLDVHKEEMIKQGKEHAYTSFMHSFAMGVGPEGVIVWQSWGAKGGYGLGDWISKGGADIRTWNEAGEFVDSFEKFAAHKVRGSSKFVDFSQ
jgi:hypothetical protein